jgi:hypothetical protein
MGGNPNRNNRQDEIDVRPKTKLLPEKAWSFVSGELPLHRSALPGGLCNKRRNELLYFLLSAFGAFHTGGVMFLDAQGECKLLLAAQAPIIVSGHLVPLLSEEYFDSESADKN